MALESNRLTYPPAPRGNDADELHGRSVPDPFRALEDPDAPGTIAWSKDQTVLFDQHQESWTMRRPFKQRLESLLQSGSVGTPAWRGKRTFYTRREPEQQHAVLYVREADGTERVLIDPMAIDPSGTTTLDAWQPSKEGSLLAYQLSEGGTEESSLRIMDVAAGSIIDGPISRVRYSPVAWLPDGQAFYYVRRLAPELVPDDEKQYHRRVYLHHIGRDPDVDTEIFGAGLDMTNYYGVSVSWDGQWLTVSAAQGTAPRNDSWIADLNASSTTEPHLVPIVTDTDARVHPHVSRDGLLYIWTDLDAPRGRLAITDPQHPQPGWWRDLLPEDPEAVLEDFAILEDLERPVLLASRTRHAVSEVRAHELNTGRELHKLELPGLGSLSGFSERPEGGHEAWFVYTDNTTPPMVLQYDASRHQVLTWAPSPGVVDVPQVHTQQVTYRSKDDTEVRMVIISPTSVPDHPRPTVLYGYGGFGISLTPAYSASVLSWVEAGGVWAVANLRGGSEEGEAWHRDGMRENKQNVFDDFTAAAEYLVDNSWTTPDQLGISGGSNGGLLVGAALTQRPDLFSSVVCSAPLLDMVRYESFGLGATWNDEYGTIAKPDELEWLLSYSPYHHVSAGTRYPSVLFTIFDGDTRVDTMHARKLAAALQEATTGGPVLLRAEGEVGHGARSVSRTAELAADQLAFLATHLGLD